MTFWIQRDKWPDRPHYRYGVVLLGEDEHGEWYGFPPGNPIYRGDEVLGHGTAGGVVCAQEGRRWTATFTHSADRWDVYCDIITPLERRHDRLWCVDIDLDVIRWIDGRVEILDEDELEEHRITYAYPDDMVAVAERDAAELFEAVSSGRAPFDGTADGWIGMRDRRFAS